MLYDIPFVSAIVSLVFFLWLYIQIFSCLCLLFSAPHNILSVTAMVPLLFVWLYFHVFSWFYPFFFSLRLTIFSRPRPQFPWSSSGFISRYFLNCVLFSLCLTIFPLSRPRFPWSSSGFISRSFLGYMLFSVVTGCV